MKNYERVTPHDRVEMLNFNQSEDMTRFYMYALRCFDLENQIENGELLMREETINTTGVTYLQTKIQDLEKENAELKAKLKKNKKVLKFAWEGIATLCSYCQNCENKENCNTAFVAGGYKLKASNCKSYWFNRAEKELQGE